MKNAISYGLTFILGASIQRIIGYELLGYGNISDVTAFWPNQTFGMAIGCAAISLLCLIGFLIS